MAIKKDTLDGLLAGHDPQAVFAKDGLFDELKKALAERVLNAEIDDHLDGEAAAGKRNSRNGYSKKRVLTETSKLDLRIPREREGTFDPKLIARCCSRTQKTAISLSEPAPRDQRHFPQSQYSRHDRPSCCERHRRPRESAKFETARWWDQNAPAYLAVRRTRCTKQRLSQRQCRRAALEALPAMGTPSSRSSQD
jgi:hypothetical protein